MKYVKKKRPRGRPPVMVPVLFEVNTLLKKQWWKAAKQNKMKLKQYLLQYLPTSERTAA